MALSADTNRSYEGESQINEHGVAASAQIYKGSAVGSSGGYARALNGGDEFMGFSLENVLGTTAGAKNVRVLHTGVVQLAVASVAVTNINDPVYASDDGTFKLTNTSASKVGVVHRFISSGQCMVKFNAGVIV